MEIPEGYTPNPWEVECVDDCGGDGLALPVMVGLFIISGDEVVVCDVLTPTNGNLPTEELVSNARLIAMAPDMATELAILRVENEKLREVVKMGRTFLAEVQQDSFYFFGAEQIEFENALAALEGGE